MLLVRCVIDLMSYMELEWKLNWEQEEHDPQPIQNIGTMFQQKRIGAFVEKEYFRINLKCYVSL